MWCPQGAGEREHASSCSPLTPHTHTHTHIEPDESSKTTTTTNKQINKHKTANNNNIYDVEMWELDNPGLKGNVSEAW